MVVVTGEVGFEKVVGIGEYLLDPAKNMAEIAFSISKEFQQKQLGKILLKKLSEAARENGISGFFAYTSPHNRGMIKLFKMLPYNVHTSFDSDALILNCRFDEPE